MTTQTCYFCGTPVAVSDHVVFCDEEQAPFKRPTMRRTLPDGRTLRCGEQDYPTNGEHSVQSGVWSRYKRIGFFAHRKCGPTSGGYWIEIDRLDDMDWDEHIARKHWYCPAVRNVLALGKEFLRSNGPS